MSGGPSAAEVTRLITAQRAELRRRRAWILACRCASLGFAAWYLELLILEGRDAPFYISINLFAVVTGLSSLVVFNYFDPPLLVRNLHGPERPLRAASIAALDPLRGEILPPLLHDLGVPAGPERDVLVATIDAPELVRRTAGKLRGDRQRFGRIYLAVYLVLALGFIALVCNYEPPPA
ncbi:MAG: hypothetical protein H0T76_01200 [Nannocystis sp.]|nr:hypothetical protein [Nannocystis sp.]MBA3545078.1 hypothetical protein [Nannocystis sp.]